MITIPRRARGRQSAASNAAYHNDLQAFADALIAIDTEFKLSGRGWCYLLEEHGLLKPDFDYAQRLINDCRKNGMLPIDFTTRDKTRATSGIETIDYSDLDMEVDSIWGTAESFVDDYRPESFWETQDYYLEIAVEKIDLVNLFRPVANQFMIPITNFKGWADINSRADMMERFSAWDRKGKTCVLLYCGDHDPGGLNISNTLLSNFDDLGEAIDIPNIEIDRFGLNYDFIMANNLSWVDNLKTSRKKPPNDLSDPRHADHAKPYVQSYLQKYGARKVEANALVTRIPAGRQLLRDTIDKYVDHDRADEYSERLEESRGELRERFVEHAKAWAERA